VNSPPRSPSIARGDTANAILDRLAELSCPFGTKSEHDGTAIIRAA